MFSAVRYDVSAPLLKPVSYSYEILNLALDGANASGWSFPRGILIITPFATFFVLLSGILVIWVIFGFIRSRFQTVNGGAKLIKWIRRIVISSVSILAVVNFITFALISNFTAFSINYEFVRSSLRANYASILGLAGLDVLYNLIRTALAVFVIVLAFKLRKLYKAHAVGSKVCESPCFCCRHTCIAVGLKFELTLIQIPSLMLGLVAFFFFAASFSALVIAILNFVLVRSESVALIVNEIIIGVFNVLLFIGLVLVARQPDFSSVVSEKGPGDYSEGSSQYL
jgi:hypothetical protein